jgi:hypothetical protein
MILFDTVCRIKFKIRYNIGDEIGDLMKIVLCMHENPDEVQHNYILSLSELECLFEISWVWGETGNEGVVC